MKKILEHAPLFIAIILMIVIFQQCERIDTLKSSVLKTQNEVETYRLKNGSLVMSQEVLRADRNSLQKQVIEKDKELKEMASKFSRISAVQQIKTRTTIPTITVPFEEPITFTPSDSTSNFTFSRSGAVFAEWYEFGYEVNNDGLTIEPFSTWTDIKRIDGFKRKWLLGRRTYHSDIMFTNPHMSVESMQTYEVIVPVRWYETTAFKFLLGFGVGVFTINQLSK
jgi:hypothetical protein